MDLNLGSTKALIDECRRQGLLRNQCAYVLATGFWETGRSMKPVKETTSAKNPNPTDAQVKRILTRAWNAGKLPWVKKDYWSDGYFGRGFVQLTHRPNYAKAFAKLGVDFVAHPEKVMEERNAVLICVTGMREGWFTGKKLSDYITLAKSDFPSARRIINGTDKKNEIAELARKYDMDLKVTGYGEGKPGSVAAAIPVPKPPPPPKPSPAPAQVAEQPHVVLMDGPKGDETTVVVVKTPQNVPQTNPTPSSKTGYAAFGAMVIAIGAAAAKYFGGS